MLFTIRSSRVIIAAASVALLSAPGVAQVRSADGAARAVSEAILERHWRALAHDSMEGRGAGTPGERRAARYIAAQFQRLELHPGGDAGTYLQRFTIAGRREDASATESSNVIGCLRGRDTTESVIIGGHYDAYGIRPRNDGGDSIYNGALDNASGVATVLAVAEALIANSATPRRTICFIAFGAEERGLLGSKAYVATVRDTAHILGMLNIDGANIWGKTRDVAVLGDDLSTLGADFRRAAAAESLSVTVHQSEARLFSASDHFSFVRAGIPALFFRRGKELIDGGAELWDQRRNDFYNGPHRRYHGPGDELLDWHTTAGAAQQARVAIRVLLDVADAQDRPRWHADAPFRKPQAP